MNLTRLEIETIRSALYSREAEILRLLDNPVLDEVDPNWKPSLRNELSAIPSLKEMMIQAWVASFTPETVN